MTRRPAPWIALLACALASAPTAPTALAQPASDTDTPPASRSDDTAHPFVRGGQALPINPPRLFGTPDCQLRATAVYRTESAVVVELEATRCAKFTLLPQIQLRTPQANLRMSDISLPSEKERYWPNHQVVRPRPGQAFYLRFPTPLAHSDEELLASGINRDLCVSFDCLNDREGLSLARAFSSNAAASQAQRAAGGDASGPSHRLLGLGPAVINQHQVEGGTFNPTEMYFHGLASLARSQPDLKAGLLKYLASTQDYEPVGVADNPFDRQDYLDSLPAERAAFVERLLSQRASPPPRSVVIFGYASLDHYDMATETLGFRSCLDHGAMRHGLYCSNGGMLLSPLQPIGERAFQLAQEGALVSRGRAKPLRFGAYQPRGPLFSLYSYGLPERYTAKVPKAVARALFEMAKNAALPAHALNQGFGNKTIGLKLLIEDFNATGLEQGTLKYASTPKAFCLFDPTGQRAVYCADLPAAKPAAALR